MPSILQRRRYTFRRQRLWTPSKAAFRACWAAGANAIYRVHAMKKNVAGQKIGAQLVSATDGSAFTGSVTVSVTVDAGIQATGTVGSGACTHEGNGYHTYAPSQAETNGDLLAFTFTGSGAIPVTIQVYTIPTTGILAPTVADRTLDVSAGGEAGIDWANVGTPSSTVSLTNTTVATTTTLTNAPSDSSGVTTLLSRIGGSITISGGRVDANVTYFGGSAGTFSSGRPEVNTSHWGGTAVASALVRSNLIQVGGSATPVTNLGIVFETDFAFNYNTDLNAWTVNTRYWDAEAVSSNSGCPFVDVSFFNSQPITATSGVNLDLLDAAISSRMATYTQPTGFLAATFPTTVASTTNITAGTITTVSGNVNGSVGSVTGAVGSVTGNVGGNVVGTIGGLTAAALADFFDTNSGTTYASAVAGSVVKEITDNAGGGGLTVGAIADGVWDEVLSGHLTAGSTGYALNAAGSAGDPWSTTLPGSYTGTQAGFVFGTLRASNLNILSPYVAEDNSLELVIGDDYYAADNRNLQFTYGASPSLSGATVYLDIQTDKDSAFEGTNITSTSGSVSGTTTQLVSFDLPGTTTDDFDEGWRAYRVRAVLSNSHTVTLTRGRLNMLSRGNDAPV